MGNTLVRLATAMHDADLRTLKDHEQKERDLLNAVRETGYFFFAGEQVYFVNARTGRLTNGDPLPTLPTPSSS